RDRNVTGVQTCALPIYLIYSSSKVVACVLLPKRYLVVNSLSASFLAFFFFLELLKSSCVLNFSFSILFNLLFVNLGLLSDVNSSSTLFPVIFSYSFSVTFLSFTNFSIIFLVCAFFMFLYFEDNLLVYLSIPLDILSLP